MATLSSLSPKSIVKVPIGGQLCECKWLAYNHYGKSEVALLLDDYQWRLQQTGINTNPVTLAGSYYDGLATFEIPFFMTSDVRAALRPVTINDGHANITRSIFLPSAAEAQLETVNMPAPGGYLRYLPTGSALGPLNTYINQTAAATTADGASAEFAIPNVIRVKNKVVFRGRMVSVKTATATAPVSIANLTGTAKFYVDCYLPRLLAGYKIQDAGSGRVFLYSYGSYNGATSERSVQLGSSLQLGAQNTDPDNISGADDYSSVTYYWFDGNRIGFPYTFRNSAYIEIPPGAVSAVTAPLIMCLDGNCEVTYSSGAYIFGRSTAVETFRKINGVWHRTD